MLFLSYHALSQMTSQRDFPILAQVISVSKSFPFEIKYIFNEHKGVSAARNRALDEASAEYVMFCDADDMFYNMCGLNLIFE